MLDAHVLKKRDEFDVDVRLEVELGGALGLFGPSGAGKSTVLACIAGAQTQDGGHVVLDGRTLFPPPLPLRRRGVGYLTQHADLFPHLSVEQNVRFGVHEATDATERWICELRDRFELATIWHARADAISGGQERRVAFARMLAPKPHLVLLDEPFAGLDRHLVREAIVSMNAWHRDLGFTLLVVDHDADILERLCAEALVVERGRTVQRGPWSELRAAPATPLLAKLLAPL